jgi:hypothetical protein
MNRTSGCRAVTAKLRPSGSGPVGSVSLDFAGRDLRPAADGVGRRFRLAIYRLQDEPGAEQLVGT